MASYRDWDETPFAEVSVEQRNAKFDEVYNGGFAKWFGIYRDVATDLEANGTYCEFLAAKVRDRVKDPEVAERLDPTDHPFGTKRVPCETDYFETYNRGQGHHWSLSADSPIIEYTEAGLRTTEAALDFDMIILATGFDAFTGALSQSMSMESVV